MGRRHAVGVRKRKRSRVSAIPTMSGETPQRLNDLTRAAMLLPLTAALLAFALAAKLYLAARGQTNKSATIKRRTNLNNRPMDKL